MLPTLFRVLNITEKRREVRPPTQIAKARGTHSVSAKRQLPAVGPVKSNANLRFRAGATALCCDDASSNSPCAGQRSFMSIIYLEGSARRSAPVELCRRKAFHYQRTALTTVDPHLRQRYLHLAKLWRELAVVAEQQTNRSNAFERSGAVISLRQFRKSK